MFGFIGVVLVRLRIFNSPTANHTSMFEVVRWALVLIALSFISTSSASVTASVVQFFLVILLIQVLRVVMGKLSRFSSYFTPRKLILVSLRFKFFPPKRVRTPWR